MNLKIDSFEDLQQAFDAMEGEDWFSRDWRRNTAYSVLAAINWVNEWQAECQLATNANYAQKKKADLGVGPVEWSGIYAEMLKGACFVLYGNGGYHRYQIHGDGEILFVRHSGLAGDAVKATKAGFSNTL